MSTNSLTYAAVTGIRTDAQRETIEQASRAVGRQVVFTNCFWTFFRMRLDNGVRLA